MLKLIRWWGHTLCSGDHCHWGVESCHRLLPLGTKRIQEQDHELSYGAQQKCPGFQASLNPSQFKIQGNTQCCRDSTLQQKIWTHRSLALYPQKQREWWANLAPNPTPRWKNFPTQCCKARFSLFLSLINLSERKMGREMKAEGGE